MTAQTGLTAAFESASSALTEAGVKGANRLKLGSFQSCGTGLAIIGATGIGDELLRVPLNVCLTGRVEDAPSAMAPALERMAAIPTGHDNTPDIVHGRLCARLWLEYLQPSTPAFAAWVPLLAAAAQQRLQASALRWSEGSLKRCGPLSQVQLFSSAAREAAEELVKALVDLSEHLPELCSRAPNVSEAEWVHLTCQARSFLVSDRLSSGGAADVPLRCLVPFLDVAHTSGSTKSGTVAELVTGTIIVSAVAALGAGDQVLCSRGACTNDQSAVTSGAVLADNAHQQVCLAFSCGSLRQEQLTVLADLELDKFLRVDENGRAIMSIVLRECDPFPNVAVVMARILAGAESSPDLQRAVSHETVLIDKPWVPLLLKTVKDQLAGYPMRDGSEAGISEEGKAANDVADIIYDTSRGVLKASLGVLLGMTRKILPE